MGFQLILAEIKKQLKNIPSYSVKPIPVPIYRARREAINLQIQHAIEENCPLIFLLGPLGVGKTTQCDYFLKTLPEARKVWKSFSKVDNLDFAFLHLTSFKSRALYILISFLMALGMVTLIPPSGALPFLLAFAYLFAKNAPHLMYIMHEALDNCIYTYPKIVVIDDLDRSSLSSNDQWALLANLWLYNNIYIINMGYPPDDKKARSKMMEYIMKLNGRIIEIVPDEKTNYHILKAQGSGAPFRILLYKDRQEGWLSLFTPREVQILFQLARTRARQEAQKRGTSVGKVELHEKCVHVFLEELITKFEWKSNEALFNEKERELQIFHHPDPLPTEVFYLTSFCDSLDLPYQVRLNFSPLLLTASEKHEEMKAIQVMPSSPYTVEEKNESTNVWGF